jgi:iron complex transport system ATP-binding protein
MNDLTLRAERVRFAYEGGAWSLALDALELGRERMVCIVGPNGSGKSSLLRLLAGLADPLEGGILLDGRPLAQMSRRGIARRIGFLPQESPSLFDFTVEDVVLMGRYVHGEGFGAVTPEDRRVVAHALDCVDIAPLRYRPLSHLSGGERRRALIASVLAQEPELLLLDEPTAALDIHHAAAVMRLLSGFGGRHPAVVVVTHDINLASLFAERLLLVAGGRLVADGPPAAVITAEIMAGAYGDDLLVERHPQTGGPLVVPVRHSGGVMPASRIG